MIAGFETRELVLAHLDALEREKQNTWGLAHLEAIEGQEALFRAELERLGDGDYEQPDPSPRQGPFPWIGKTGHEYVA